jgi:hypothetical protein
MTCPLTDFLNSFVVVKRMQGSHAIAHVTMAGDEVSLPVRIIRVTSAWLQVEHETGKRFINLAHVAEITLEE